MTELPLIFAAGFAGSVHCIGMCGGFACGIGGDPRGAAATVRRQLLYNAGRIASYCFIGAMAGAFGLWLIGADGSATRTGLAQRGFALVSGVLMIAIGLQFVGVLRHRARGFAVVTGAVARRLGALLDVPAPAMPLAFGVVNGWLPCPLVYAFAAQATATGDPAGGVAVMAAFGLGTMPAMLLTAWAGLRARRAIVLHDLRRGGGASASLPVDWRIHGVRLAGVFIVVLGVITIARGALPMMAALHAH